MAQLAQLTQEEGNTRTSSKRRRAWLLVWNNYSEDDLKWTTQFAQINCSQFALNEEIGKKEGTPHIQGALYLTNARTFEQMKNLFPKCHLEGAISWKHLKIYSTKEDTRKPGTKPITEKIEIKDPLEGRELYPFQKNVLEILDSKPDDRTVHWFWEPTGCTGKTSLVKSICIKNPETCIFLNGKAADMKCAIAKRMEDGPAPKIVLLGLPRTAEDYTGSLYQGLEEIKDGIFFSGKYESKMIMFDSPHVMVFANWPPCMDKLSEDRWNVVEITGE